MHEKNVTKNQKERSPKIFNGKDARQLSEHSNNPGKTFIK